MKYLISTIFIIVFVHSVSAQEWLDLYNQALQDYDNYDLTGAREKCDRALSIFKTDVGEEHANAAAILRQLAIICYESGDIADGIEYGKKEISILDAIEKTQDENYGTALYNLGILHLANNEPQFAEPLLRRSLDIYLLHFLENEYEVAQVQGNLAIALFQNGDVNTCQDLFKKSLTTFDSYEDKPFEYVNIAYHYAESQIDAGAYENAISILNSIIDYVSDQDSDIDAGSVLLKIGSAYEEMSDIQAAQNYYNRAIKSFESNGGTNAADYKLCLNNLTLLYQQQGNLTEARRLANTVIDAHANNKDDMYYQAMCNMAAIDYTNGNFESSSKIYSGVIGRYENRNIDEMYLAAANGLILINIQLKMFPEALAIANEATVSAEGSGIANISLLKHKSMALSGLGKYKEAQQVLQQALQQQSVEGDQDIGIKSDLQLTLADLYTSMGRYESAGELYKICGEYFAQNKSSSKYGLFLGNYATYLQATGSFKTAEVLLIEALEIKEKQYGPESEDYLVTYENLCLLYMSTGRYEKARSNLLRIKQTKEASQSTSDFSQASTLVNLGIILRLTGDYPNSEELLKEAIKKYTGLYGSNNVYVASASNELGLLYLKMGNTKTAAPLFENALTIFENSYTKYNTDYASVLENLATLSHLEGNNERSVQLLQEVLEIDEAMLGTSHPLYSKTLHNLASIHEELGNYEESSALYLKALSIQENLFGKDHPSYANTLYNMAVLEQQKENLDDALKYYNEALSIRRKILNSEHPDIAHSIYGVASIKQKMGDYEGARSDYKSSVSIYLNSIRNYFPSLSESEKSAFYGKIRPVFEAFQDFAVSYVSNNQGSEESRNELLGELYNLQLSTKALLLNATNKVKQMILNSGNATLINKFNEWQLSKEEIVKALGMSKEKLSKNNLDISVLEQKANELEKELSKISSLFASEFDKSNIDWKQVQSALMIGEAAMEIIRIKKNIRNDSVVYAGLILMPDSYPKLIVINHGNDLETKYFKQYKNSIVYKVQNKKAYGQFWRPYDAALSSTKTIFLSSDGVYNKVNVSTLYDDTSQKYLFDKYKVFLLSNTKELLEKDQLSKQQPQKYATLFGYPSYELGTNESSSSVSQQAAERGFSQGISQLPGTLTETENIASTLDNAFWKYDKYLKGEANEVNVKNMRSPKLLHIATHGFFMEDIGTNEEGETGLHSRAARFNPLFRSGLLMAGVSNAFRGETLPGSEDGILTAYEAMNLNLDNTELVVMSACETGLGEVKNGEGVYGLQRAFLVAGADNLIMSLWKVNDETTQMLMSMFYDQWISGSSKQVAFRKAIESIKLKYDAPYYWGAFVMLGK